MAPVGERQLDHLNGFCAGGNAIGLELRRDFVGRNTSQSFFVWRTNLPNDGVIGFNESPRLGIEQGHSVSATLKQEAKHGFSLTQFTLAGTRPFVPLLAGWIRRIHPHMKNESVSDAGLHAENCFKPAHALQVQDAMLLLPSSAATE